MKTRNILFFQYFEYKNPKRKKDLEFCFEKNISNPCIDEIVVFNEEKTPLPFRSEKIIEIHKPRRLKVEDWLLAIKCLYHEKANYMLINSDIYLDETINFLQDHPYYFLCNSRWEDDKPIAHRAESQDLWICSHPDLITYNLIAESYFELGRPGVDNAFAFVLNKHGLLSGNWCSHIRATHVHDNPHTEPAYTEAERIHHPYYFIS